MKTDEKYTKKSLKVKQKVKEAGLLGLFCESKKSKKSVGKKSIFSIFRKIDLIDFFDSIDSPSCNAGKNLRLLYIMYKIEESRKFLKV